MKTFFGWEQILGLIAYILLKNIKLGTYFNISPDSENSFRKQGNSLSFFKFRKNFMSYE